MAFRPSLGLSLASRRCLCTSLRANYALRASKPTRLLRPAVQQSFRRAYADAPTINLSPTPRPRKRFRFLRWTWRVTYLSAIGFVGWLSFTVWELRNPNDQFDPDPSKKTLVILGELRLDSASGAFAYRGQEPVGARYLY
jgi:NADH:ubiquinone reductase (non-electrogenic)